MLHISPNVNFNYLGVASLPHILHPVDIRYIYTVQFRFVENSENRYKYIQRTSWPYFGVKLSCVCLKFALNIKEKNIKVGL